jgi:hypothetical protein
LRKAILHNRKKEGKMTEGTTTVERPANRGATVERFAYFWASPDTALLQGSFTEDVAGYFPGDPEPARGPDAYIARVGRFLELLPDLRLEVAEYATNGEFTFIRWTATATGTRGPFEFSGMDRIRTRGELVSENIVVFDTALFRTLSGLEPA